MPENPQADPPRDLRARTVGRFIELLREDDSLPSEIPDALANVMDSGTVTRETVLAALQENGEDNGAAH
jgi:hypothetical protein